jgi:hypothetical protein
MIAVEGCIDFPQVCCLEAKFCGANNTTDLMRAAEAHNCSCDGRVVEGPRYRNFSGRAAMTLANLA